MAEDKKTEEKKPVRKSGFDRYLDFQYRSGGSFFKALFLTIQKADKYNLPKLALGFPEEVEAYKTWTRVGVEEFAKRCLTRDKQFVAFCREYDIEFEITKEEG